MLTSPHWETNLFISPDLVFGDIYLALVNERVIALLTRADTDNVFHRTDEYSAVTLGASGRRPLNGLHHLLNFFLAYNEIQLYAGQCVDHIGAMPSGKLDSTLTTVPLNFDSIDSGDANFNQSQPDTVQFLLSDVRFDFLNTAISPVCRKMLP